MEQGIAGVRLEVIYAGGTRCTSKQAIQRFFERVTAARTGGPPDPATNAPQPIARTRTESQRHEAATKAGEAFDRMGDKPKRRGRKALADAK
jgi:hypothetical protein